MTRARAARAALAAALLVLAAHGCTRPATVTVAVQNNRFADGSGDTPSGWQSIAWARETVQFGWTPPGPDGEGAAVIHNLEPNDARWCQSVAVEPGAGYRVSARVRTSDVGTDTAGAHVGVERIADSADLRGTHDWQPLNLTARVGEETHWDVCLRLGSYSNLNTGTAWFTDVSVVRVAAPPPRAGIVALTWAWARSSGSLAVVPLVGGALLAFGLGIGRRRVR